MHTEQWVGRTTLLLDALRVPFIGHLSDSCTSGLVAISQSEEHA